MSIKNRIEKLGRARKSLSISFISQLTTSVVSFVMVPMLIKYLGKEQYGLWVTLISLVGWILASDFGIGYGFRNRVTEYLADHDKDKLTGYFKNTFQYYLLITFIIALIFTYVLFNNPILSKYKVLSVIIYVPYIVYFPFSISNQILQGLRFVHYTVVINLLRAVLWAAFVVSIITLWKDADSLVYVAIGYSVVNSLTNITLVYLAFTKSDIEIPGIRSLLSKPIVDSTLLTGAKFFILQISTLLLFSMGNYYIYSNLSPTDTANYDTVNKIYTLYMTFFNMIISVFWSEIVYQRTTGDRPKLRQTYRKLLSVSFLVSAGSFIIMFIAPFIISLWTNDRIVVDWNDCLPFSFMISVQAIAYAGAVFLNAFERVMPQVILAVVNILLIYPLLRLGFDLHIGMATVPIVSGILTLPALIVCHRMALKLTSVSSAS